MYTTGGTVTHACALLIQTAMLYNVVMMPLRFVYKLPTTQIGSSLDFITDRILIFDLFMSIFDLLIEDGEPRKPKVVRALFTQEWFYIVLHAMASIDLLWTGANSFFPAHVSLRVLRFLRLPHLMTALMPYADVTKKILLFASAQLGLLAVCELLGNYRIQSITFGLVNPSTSLMAAFVLLGVVSVIEARRKAAQKQAAESAPKPQQDNPQNLDEICQQIVENNRMMKKVIADERDPVKFVDTVMSKLKHESFPPGTALATIGEVGHHMFFLARGTVKGKTKTRSFEMGAGSAFGEIALMCPMSKRTANITTVTNCEIFLLSREGFDQIRSAYPALGRLVREEVTKYLRGDSSNYVGSCIKTALQCCCFMGISFFTLIYAVTSL